MTTPRAGQPGRAAGRQLQSSIGIWMVLVLVAQAAALLLVVGQLRTNATLIREDAGLIRAETAQLNTYLGPGGRFEGSHARTQRLVCADLRAAHAAIPADPATGRSDCAGR